MDCCRLCVLSMGEVREWVLMVVVGVVMLWKFFCVWFCLWCNKFLLFFLFIEDVVIVCMLMVNVEFLFVCYLFLEFVFFWMYVIFFIFSIFVKVCFFDNFLKFF